MDIVAVSGFGLMIGLGGLGWPWAFVKDAKTETDIMPTGTTTRATDRNIQNPPTSPGASIMPRLGFFRFKALARLNQRLLRPVVGREISHAGKTDSVGGPN
jgi:hypothetical protein